MSTIFTKIINKEIPADILFENDNVLAFRDINPQAPIHFLVIPKKEIRTLNDIEEVDKDIIGELFIVAKDLAEKEGIAESGYRAVFNCNEHGAQTVYHLHLHVLGGRQLNWPPG
jgi:histidine triad (HIT) family protein